jgi:peptide/nickel transport system substrate-binding protein
MTLLAVSMVVALTATSCGSNDDGGAEAVASQEGIATNLVVPDEPTPGGQLVVGLEAETDGWDPVANQFASAGLMVASAIYDPLMTATTDGNVEPMLAESMEANADFTEWTINLRPGVTFHDGTEFDSEDVISCIQASREGLFTQYGSIAIEDVQAIDPLTVQVSMSEPWASYPWSMAGSSGLMRPAEAVGDEDFGNHPVGTGPFVFDSWEPGGSLEVVKNEDYWQEGLPYLDSIEYRVFTDPGTRSNALEAGDVDLIQTTSDEDILRFRTTEFTQVEDPDSEETMVMLNTDAAPFDNLIARQALAYATNQSQLIQTIGSGIALPADSPFSEDEDYWAEDTGFPTYDPEKARELVAQYEAETGQPLEFAFSGVPDIETVALQQLLISMWSDVGIEASINTVEQQQYILDVAQGGYQAAWFRNFAYAQPDFLYLFWGSRFNQEVGDISLNFTHFEDPELDDLLIEARGIQDREVRAGLYQEATEIVNAAVPYVWLYHTPWALVARPGVHGLDTPFEIGFARLDAKPWVGELWIEE